MRSALLFVLVVAGSGCGVPETPANPPTTPPPSRPITTKLDHNVRWLMSAAPQSEGLRFDTTTGVINRCAFGTDLQIHCLVDGGMGSPVRGRFDKENGGVYAVSPVDLEGSGTPAGGRSF